MPQPDVLAAGLTPLLAGFLPHQRWFPDDAVVERLTITSLDVHRKEPLLLWILVEVTPSDAEPATYQLVIGGRPEPAPPEILDGRERLKVGSVDGWLFYDALVDPELALDVLGVVAPDETATRARPLVVEQTNSSVVYDDRLILKLFRRLHPKPHPDVEVNRVLAERGFPHVVRQRAELRREGVDLAVVRDYLRGSSDAWQIAHTSLRDMLGSRLPPEEASADFAPEAAALGEVTAKLHAALADAFGTSPAETEVWMTDMHAQLERLDRGDLDRARLSTVLERLVAVDDPGVAMRIHGDLHLSQFLSADRGWLVLDFEGEPNRPLDERARPSSPLRDVAGMLRSFHYASRAALVERGSDVDPELDELATAWEQRAVDAYWSGYRRGGAANDTLLPAGEAAQQRLLAAFELDKAVYEVGYELAHRPNWVDIPISAINRILERST